MVNDDGYMRSYNPIHPYLMTLESGEITCVQECSEVDPNMISGPANTCICRDGYEMINDRCMACSDLHWACTDCDLTANPQVCLECKQEFQVLSPDKQECWNKLYGCELRLEDQDWSFFDTNSYLIDSNGFYVCPRCKEGYFWQDSNSTTAGKCVKCYHEIDNCLECISETRCTRCKHDLFPSWDGSECVSGYDNCAVTPSEYVRLDDGGYTCPYCDEGYAWSPDDSECVACGSLITGCEACSDVETCTSCSGTNFPSPDGSVCVGRIPRCGVEPEEYAAYLGEWWCPTCETGKVWDWNDMECDTCTNAIPNCSYCDKDGTCVTCDEGYYPSYSGKVCEPEYTHCRVPDHLYWTMERPDDSINWVCQECDDGYIFGERNGVWNCYKECDVIHELCSECEFHVDEENRIVESECTACGHGYLPSPSGLSCVPHVANCASMDNYVECPSSDSWKCDTCEDGYYLDNGYCRDIEVCHCKVGDGLKSCLECQEGWHPTNNGQECHSDFERCSRDMTGEFNLTHIQGKSACSKCLTGYTFSWDHIDGRDCYSCSTFIPGCVACTNNEFTSKGDDITCDICESGMYPDTDGKCRQGLVPHCEIGEGAFCEKCLPFYSYNFRTNVCEKCSTHFSHCLECDPISDDLWQKCNKCPTLTQLNDNKCQIENCYEYKTLRKLDASDNFLFHYSLCEVCNDGYGFNSENMDTLVGAMTESTYTDRHCLPCEIDDCIDCTFTGSIYSEVAECTLCTGGKVPNSDGSACQWPTIPGCVEYDLENGDCLTCGAGFFQVNEKQCRACDHGCDECEFL